MIDMLDDDADDITDDASEPELVAATPKPGRKKRPGAGDSKGFRDDGEVERKKRELITMGKAKGYLTYEDVNDHMPESVVSSDQIGVWLSALGGEGIEIVENSAASMKVG